MYRGVEGHKTSKGICHLYVNQEVIILETAVLENKIGVSWLLESMSISLQKCAEGWQKEQNHIFF